MRPIRKLRLSLGMSQTKLATFLGTSFGNIRRLDDEISLDVAERWRRKVAAKGFPAQADAFYCAVLSTQYWDTRESPGAPPAEDEPALTPTVVQHKKYGETVRKIEEIFARGQGDVAEMVSAFVEAIHRLNAVQGAGTSGGATLPATDAREPGAAGSSSEPTAGGEPAEGAGSAGAKARGG
jgi:transcriptional regulator with XRE-family HTH domain